MARRTPSEIYAAAIAAGFNTAQATVITAISLSESGGDDTQLGDVNLETTTWGPSYGLFQVRTLKSATGTGQIRDISWLASSDVNQARAAYAISGGGKDWTAWTDYNTGKWRRYLGQAQGVAGAAPAGYQTAAGGPAPTFGPDWLPWNWVSNAVNQRYTQALGGARQIALEGVFVVLGVGLVAGGLAKTFQPQLDRGLRAVRGTVKKGLGG